MARTSGTIEPRGPNNWRIRLFVGAASDGRRRYFSQQVAGSRKDAERVLRELVNKKEQSNLGQLQRIPLSTFLERWLELGVRPKLRSRSAEHYERYVRIYVKPYLGNPRLDRLHPLELQRWINTLTERGLSTRTVRGAYATVRTAFRWGVRMGLLTKDPTDIVEIPKLTSTREVVVMDPVESRAFLEAARGRRFEAYFVLALCSACRPGELAALRWSDVDLHAGTISIRRTLARTKAGIEFTEPKTDRGRRNIPLPRSAVACLERHRRCQLEARLASGGGWVDNDLVFTDRNGNPIDLTNLRNRHLRRILAEAGLPAEITLYSLRHTAATLLLEAGVHVKAVSERLGHASTAFTMDTYVHSLPTAQEHAAAMIEETLFAEQQGMAARPVEVKEVQV